MTEAVEAYKGRQARRIAVVVPGPTVRHRERQSRESRESRESRDMSKQSNGDNTYSKQSNGDNTYSQSHDEQSTALLQLQVENSQLSAELFSTLAATESSILHLARLQSTLQSHLQLQHDLTLRLCDESAVVEAEVRKGNQFLRRAGESSSMGRRVLVVMMLGASVVLLLLHYLKG